MEPQDTKRKKKEQKAGKRRKKEDHTKVPPTEVLRRSNIGLGESYINRIY